MSSFPNWVILNFSVRVLWSILILMMQNSVIAPAREAEPSTILRFMGLDSFLRVIPCLVTNPSSMKVACDPVSIRASAAMLAQV